MSLHVMGSGERELRRIGDGTRFCRVVEGPLAIVFQSNLPLHDGPLRGV